MFRKCLLLLVVLAVICNLPACGLTPDQKTGYPTEPAPATTDEEARLPSEPTTPVPDQESELQPTSSQIEYRRLDDQRTHILKVDLTNPYIRFQVVVAEDKGGTERETVESMAKRYGPIAAVNGDYFGTGHGAEGMTYINGNEINKNEYRSSLAISKLNRANIGKGHAPNLMYSVIGGGPQFVSGGEAYWNRDPRHNDVINGEGFDNSSYWDDGVRQTAVGITADGETLILAVSEVEMTPLEIAAILIEQGAYTAMKLDGGGSSSLYYNGQSLVKGRQVADALLVFSGIEEVTLTNDAQLDVSAKEITGSPGEPLDFSVTAENTGTSTWTEGNRYRLGWKIGYEPFLNGHDYIRLALDPGESIAPGDLKLWHVTGLKAPYKEGTYVTRWQMVHEEVEWFGNKATTEVVVEATEPPTDVLKAYLAALYAHDIEKAVKYVDPTDRAGWLLTADNPEYFKIKYMFAGVPRKTEMSPVEYQSYDVAWIDVILTTDRGRRVLWIYALVKHENAWKVTVEECRYDPEKPGYL